MSPCSPNGCWPNTRPVTGRCIPTEAETNGIVDLVQLAEMSGYSRASIKQRVFTRKLIAYKTIGWVTVAAAGCGEDAKGKKK